MRRGVGGAGCVRPARFRLFCVAAALLVLGGCASVHPPTAEREIDGVVSGGTTRGSVLCELSVTSHELVFPNHSRALGEPTEALVRLHTTPVGKSSIAVEGVVVVFGDDDGERTWELLGPDRVLKIVRPAAELATFARAMETTTSRTVRLRSDDRGQLYTEIRLR